MAIEKYLLDAGPKGALKNEVLKRAIIDGLAAFRGSLKFDYMARNLSSFEIEIALCFTVANHKAKKKQNLPGKSNRSKGTENPSLQVQKRKSKIHFQLVLL